MDQEVLILLPDQSLTFSSSDHFKYKILKYVIQNTPKIVIIDGRYVRAIDVTVAKVSGPLELPIWTINWVFFFCFQSLCTVVEDLQLLQRKVYFWHWGKEPMGVLCRLDSKMFSLFKDAQTEDELLKSTGIENSKQAATVHISSEDTWTERKPVHSSKLSVYMKAFCRWWKGKVWYCLC